MTEAMLMKIRCALLVLGLCLPAVCTSASVYDADAILKRADSFRVSSLNVQLNVRVAQYDDEASYLNGTPSKKRHYKVLSKTGRRTLVLFLSPAEVGQKMLMLDERYWLLMPRSRRPIRITPAQKLLGDASSGDISTLTWSEDYAVQAITEAEYEGRAALALSLIAKVKGVSYQSIRLLVDRNSYQPLSAALYLSSRKLAKRALYEVGVLNGEARVVRMILHDRLATQRRTVIHYTDIREVEVEDKVYNPAYLLRNPEM